MQPQSNPCSACQTTALLPAAPRVTCSRTYQMPMAQPHTIYPPFGYVSPANAPFLPPQDVLSDLERRYRAADKRFISTFLAGIFFLWPLWLLTFMEYNKMHEILWEVAALGIDPEGWARTLCL